MSEDQAWLAQAAACDSEADELSAPELALVQLQRACTFTMLSLAPAACISFILLHGIPVVTICYANLKGPFACWWMIRSLSCCAPFPFWVKYGLPSMGIQPGFAPQIAYCFTHLAILYFLLLYFERILRGRCDILTLAAFTLSFFVARVVGFAFGMCASRLSEALAHEDSRTLENTMEEDETDKEPEWKVFHMTLAPTTSDKQKCSAAREALSNIVCMCLVAASACAFYICGFMLQPAMSGLRDMWPRAAVLLSIAGPLMVKHAQNLLHDAMVSSGASPTALEPLCHWKLYVFSAHEFCSKLAIYSQRNLLDIVVVQFGQAALEILFRFVARHILQSRKQFDYSLLEQNAFGDCNICTGYPRDTSSAQCGSRISSKSSCAPTRSTATGSLELISGAPVFLPRLLGRHSRSLQHGDTQLEEGVSDTPGDISVDMLQEMIVASLLEDTKDTCEYAAHVGVAAACWKKSALSSNLLGLALLVGLVIEVGTDLVAAFLERASGMRGVARYRMPLTSVLIVALLCITACNILMCIMVLEFTWALF